MTLRKMSQEERASSQSESRGSAGQGRGKGGVVGVGEGQSGGPEYELCPCDVVRGATQQET